MAGFEAGHGEITEAEMSEAARRARGRAVVVRGEPAPRHKGGPGERRGPPEVLVLDAGAFVAVERGDRDVVALIKRERLAGRVPVSHGGVVAQVWRRGDRPSGAGGPAAGRGGYRCAG